MELLLYAERLLIAIAINIHVALAPHIPETLPAAAVSADDASTFLEAEWHVSLLAAPPGYSSSRDNVLVSV